MLNYNSESKQFSSDFFANVYKEVCGQLQQVLHVSVIACHLGKIGLQNCLWLSKLYESNSDNLLTKNNFTNVSPQNRITSQSINMVNGEKKSVQFGLSSLGIIMFWHFKVRTVFRISTYYFRS